MSRPCQSGWQGAVLTLAMLTATDSLAEGLTLRLTKAPESKDWERPAIASFTRSDGGESSYYTQGTVAYGWADMHPFGPGSALIPEVRASWAKNTLAGQEQDAHSLAVDGTLAIGSPTGLNFLLLTGSAGIERNRLESANARTGSVDALLGNEYLLSSKLAWPVAWAVFPGAGAFIKDVRDAPADKDTGVAPTGKLRGYYGGVSITIIPNFLGGPKGGPIENFVMAQRWSLKLSSQIERTTSVVAGDVKGTHRLHAASINYSFVDPPLHKTANATGARVIPGLSLSRQVGSDPWNEVAKGGFTTLQFTLKY